MKVLILISETGGGHRSAAEALAEGFHARLGDQVQVRIVDLITEHTFWPLNLLRHTYRPMVDDAMWLWRTIWHLGERPLVIRAIERIFTPLTSRPVGHYFRQQAPDLVVTVHPLVNHAALRVLRRAGLMVPFATVVTDLVTAPPVWFCPDADLCCVPTEAARERALKCGMPPERVVVTGMPISLKYRRPPVGPQERASIRQRLGLHPELPTVLIVSGGEGMGPVGPIATSVADALAREITAQMIIVCGRNRTLAERLKGLSWPIPVSIQGFVHNMPEWMAASDCIVTKAGPGTICEALCMGLPILLSGFIPGQETGNVPYVVENGVGAYAEDPEEIAGIVVRWLRPGNPELHEMRARARALAQPDAVLTIVDKLLNLIECSREKLFPVTMNEGE
ncbi:MAG TPA: glycosyltransferase [Caldilineae bacterium]|jgi:1,2-diacylglycerol 3-beta-galactosyltransferase|nr:glycosyltransferase [Caldilineae bacterium]